MAGEARFWAYLRKGMRGRWHAQRHEDRLSAGVPDVSYALNGVDGWIELKALDRWPKRAGTRVTSGLTLIQGRWLVDRAQKGNGQCFIFLKVGRDYLLWRWIDAHILAPTARVNQAALKALAMKKWENRIDFDELAEVLATPMSTHEEWRDVHVQLEDYRTFPFA